MSLNDSFIKEVSEEVRRDKLFKYIKKYSWFGFVAIFIIVSIVAFNEWKKNNEKINYQLNGDELSFFLKIKSKNYTLSQEILY